METASLISTLNPFVKNQDVLLIDDDEFNHIIIKEYLDPLEINLTVAINGMEGLKLIKQKPFAFVLIDLEMPIMDGKTMLKEVAAESHYDTPTFVLSGYNLNQKDDVLQHPFVHGYLLKPFVPGSLYQIILKPFINKK